MQAATPIGSDPEILGGECVFAGTRVPVRSLFEHLEAGDSNDECSAGFPSVTRTQIIAVWAQSRDRILQPT